MANQEHLTHLTKGVEHWNAWRRANPYVRPDLSGADLRGNYLQNADLRGVNLREANADEAFLNLAKLNRADLRGASFRWVRFFRAKLRGTKLQGARLLDADFNEADLTGADLTGADLTFARFIRTNISGAILSGSRVFGISAWCLIQAETAQQDLVVTSDDEPAITVDDLEVAQFVYLLLDNRKIRNVINTITEKTVLILGRFTPERKEVLDRLRVELRRRGYLPILFDFEKPARGSTTETVLTLAGLSRFIIADLTDAASVQQELTAIKTTWDSVPVKPILLKGSREWAMFPDLMAGSLVLEPYVYKNQEKLIANLDRRVIAPAVKAGVAFNKKLDRLIAAAAERRHL